MPSIPADSDRLTRFLLPHAGVRGVRVHLHEAWRQIRAREDYPVIVRTKAFWILLGAMLLCNLPATIMLVQLKLLLLDNGVSGDGAAVMLSALPLGMLAGRFVAGLSLDRYRPLRPLGSGGSGWASASS